MIKIICNNFLGLSMNAAPCPINDEASVSQYGEGGGVTIFSNALVGGRVLFEWSVKQLGF